MTSPLQTQITDLPAASVVNDTDYTIIRQGLADFKAQMSLIRVIDISAFPAITTPGPSDQLLVNRSGQNYSVRFDQVGFVAGSVMWFYQAAAPTGWEIVNAAGDRLLAVRGGTNKYQSFGEQGDWQQSGHKLTVAEMPGHRHRILKTKDTTGASNNLGPVRGKEENGGFYQTESTGGNGSSDSLGTGQEAVAHNHGNTWRPAANVGILARKLA